MSKRKIIYVAPFSSGFIQQDIELISNNNKVYVDHWNWKCRLMVIPNMFMQFLTFIFLLFHFETIIISFGGYWSVVPSLLGKLFKKKILIILNGTDCASIPSYNYGSLRKKYLKKAIGISYKNATKLLPVSNSLLYTNNYYGLSKKESFQGLKVHFPNLKTPTLCIPNAYDSNFWSMDNQLKKHNNSFIAVFSKEQFYLKGGDLIVKIAKSFPSYKFYIAGLDKPTYIKEVTSNVIFLGFLTKDKLKYYYSISKFHFQLSIFEGFGGALCEAMLCECIPIGSSVNVIPEIIGDTGFILDKKDLQSLTQLIKRITSIDTQQLGGKARKRIISNYNMKKRGASISKQINN